MLATGAAGAIGSAICWRFAQEGAKLGVADRNTEGAAHTVKALRTGGAEAWPFAFDIADRAAAQRAVAQFSEATGGLVSS